MQEIGAYSYYYALRSEARRRVVASLNKRARTGNSLSRWADVTICSIDRKALNFARIEWPKYYRPGVFEGFEKSWEHLIFRYAPKPSFFDIAVWQKVGGEDVLQGMALGKPNRSKSSLSLNWVETSLAPTYMRGGVLFPILACAEEYAKLLGSSRVLIKNAIDPGVYQKYGYAPSAEADLAGALYKGI